MKPFNLAEALAGKPVVTRDGRNVTGIAHLPSITHDFRVIALINGHMSTFTERGTWCPNAGADSDLFMAEETREWFVNVYPEDRYPAAYASIAEADVCSRDRIVGRVKITVQDGNVSAEVVA